MPAEDVSVEAVFAKITYVITASGSLTYEGIAQMGETITLTAGTAPEGKEFDYFTVDGEKIDGNTFTMPASNVEISVVWKDAVKSGCGSSIAFASSAVSLLCVALVAALAVVKRRVK